MTLFVIRALVFGVFIALSSATKADEHRHDEFPSSPQMKSALTALGFEAQWRTTQGGEKLTLENGELWLRENNYFAVMPLSDTNEKAMYLSLMDNLGVCTKLAMATTGGSSSAMFSMYGEMVKQALLEPETAVEIGGTLFQYHLLVTEMIKDTPLMQCGIKRN